MTLIQAILAALTLIALVTSAAVVMWLLMRPIELLLLEDDPKGAAKTAAKALPAATVILALTIHALILIVS